MPETEKTKKTSVTMDLSESVKKLNGLLGDMMLEKTDAAINIENSINIRTLLKKKKKHKLKEEQYIQWGTEFLKVVKEDKDAKKKFTFANLFEFGEEEPKFYKGNAQAKNVSRQRNSEHSITLTYNDEKKQATKDITQAAKFDQLAYLLYAELVTNAGGDAPEKGVVDEKNKLPFIDLSNITPNTPAAIKAAYDSASKYFAEVYINGKEYTPSKETGKGDVGFDAEIHDEQENDEVDKDEKRKKSDLEDSAVEEDDYENDEFEEYEPGDNAATTDNKSVLNKKDNKDESDDNQNEEEDYEDDEYEDDFEVDDSEDNDATTVNAPTTVETRRKPDNKTVPNYNVTNISDDGNDKLEHEVIDEDINIENDEDEENLKKQLEEDGKKDDNEIEEEIVIDESLEYDISEKLENRMLKENKKLEISKLKDEIVALKKQLKHNSLISTGEKDSLNTQLKNYKDEKKNSEETLKYKISEQEKTIMMLTSRIREYHSKIKNLTKQNKENENLRLKLMELEATIKLKEESQELITKQSAQEKAALKNQLKVAEKKNTITKKEAEQKETESKEEIESLEKEIGLLTDKVKVAEIQTEQKESETASAQDELRKAQLVIESLENEKKQSQSSVASLKKENGNLKDKLSQMEKIFNHQERRVNIASAEVFNQNSIIKKLTGENKAQRLKIEEQEKQQESQNEQQQEYRSQIQKQTGRIRSLEEERNKLKQFEQNSSKLDSLNRELARKLEELMRKYNKQQKKLDALEIENTALDSKNTKFNQTITDQQKEIIERRAMDKKQSSTIIKLEKGLEKAQRQNTSLSTDLDEAKGDIKKSEQATQKAQKRQENEIKNLKSDLEAANQRAVQAESEAKEKSENLVKKIKEKDTLITQKEEEIKTSKVVAQVAQKETKKIRSELEVVRTKTKDEIKKKTEALDTANKHLTERNEKLQSDLGDQANVNGEQSDTIEEQKKMIEALKSDLKTQSNENGKLTDVSKVTAEQINGLEQSLQAANNKVRQAEDNTDRMQKNFEAEKDELQLQIDTQKKENEEANEKITNLKAEVRKKDSFIVKLKDDAKSETNQIRSELEQMKTTINVQIGKKTEALNKANEALNRQKRDLEIKLGEEKSKNDQLTNGAKNSDVEISKLGQELKDQRTKNEKLQHDFEALEEEALIREKSIQTMTQANETNLKSQANVNRKQSKTIIEQKGIIKNLESDLKDVNSQLSKTIDKQEKMITSLESNLETQRNENGKLSDVSKVTAGKINDLEQDLKAAKEKELQSQAIIKELQSQLADQKKVNSKQTETQKAVLGEKSDQIRSIKEQAKNDKAQSQKMIFKAEAETKALEAELKKLKAVLASKSEHNDELVPQVQILEEKVTNLKASVEEKDRVIQQQEKKKDEYEKQQLEINSLKHKLRNSESQIDTFNQEIVNAEQERNNLKANNSELLEEIAQHLEQIKYQKAQIDNAEKRNHESNEKTKTLNSREVNVLKRELKQLTANLTLKNKQISTAQSRIDELDDQLKTSKKEHKTLTTRNNKLTTDIKTLTDKTKEDKEQAQELKEKLDATQVKLSEWINYSNKLEEFNKKQAGVISNLKNQIQENTAQKKVSTSSASTQTDDDKSLENPIKEMQQKSEAKRKASTISLPSHDTIRKVKKGSKLDNIADNPEARTKIYYGITNSNNGLVKQYILDVQSSLKKDKFKLNIVKFHPYEKGDRCNPKPSRKNNSNPNDDITLDELNHLFDCIIASGNTKYLDTMKVHIEKLFPTEFGYKSDSTYLSTELNNAFRFIDEAIKKNQAAVKKSSTVSRKKSARKPKALDKPPSKESPVVRASSDYWKKKYTKNEGNEGPGKR
jgi:chromosome segregation ATPase